MKQTKTLLLKLFLFVEVFIFLVIYLLGTNGVHTIIRLTNDNKALSNDIALLEKDIKQLSLDLKDWQESSFLKEKVAREHLQMARKNETVYFLS